MLWRSRCHAPQPHPPSRPSWQIHPGVLCGKSRRSADFLLDESWSEADAELGDPYAEGFGREHVPELVDDYEEDQPQQRDDDGHRRSPPARLSASLRAQASTATMASMLCIIPKSGTASRTSSITSAICRNLTLPSRKAWTATSLAALSATG